MEIDEETKKRAGELAVLMEEIDDDTRKHFGELAERLMCAYVSHMGGVSYETIRKNYGPKAGKPIGDYWIMLAVRTTQDQTLLQGLRHQLHEESIKS